MGKRRQSVLADLCFLAMLILMFAAVLFLAADHVNLARNTVIFCIVTVLLMVTYFASIRTGLVLDIVFVFLLVAYTVLQSMKTGEAVPAGIFFWIFWPAAMTAAVAGYVGRNRLLDRENQELVRRTERFITIDELTQLNNLLGFERDAAVYMNISRRYGMQLELVLWRLTYQEDLERLLGREELEQAICMISDAIKSSLRREDLVYLVDKEPYIWGTLLFSKPEAAEIVIQHVREGVQDVGLKELTRQKAFSLEIIGTVITYDGSAISPLAFLNKAKRQLWRKEYHMEPAEESK